MIPRYTRPEMASIWTDENKFSIWLRIEVLACEAMNKLGVVPAKDLRNIKRKAAYTSGAPAGSTVEQFAFVTGCNLIAKTRPGEKYKAPDGRWLTRDSGAPVRDSRCP